MKTDENKERSATPNIQTIAQWDFIKLNSVKALIFDGEVDHWNQSGAPLKLEQLEESWQTLIVETDPRKREQKLSNILTTLGETSRDVENEIEENKSQESLNREKSPHCEQVYAAIDRNEIPPGAVVTAPKAESPAVVWRETGEDRRRWQLLTGEIKPRDQIHIKRVSGLRYKRADLQRKLSKLLQEIDFFKTKAEVEQIALRPRSKSAGRKRDPKAEKRREKMFEFLKKKKVKNKEKAADKIRHEHTFRYQLYDYFEKNGVELISSDNYRRITAWTDLKQTTHVYLDGQATDYLVRDMQRHWDRFWDK